MEMALDVNTQLYPLDLGDRFTVVLTTTLHEVNARPLAELFC